MRLTEPRLVHDERRSAMPRAIRPMLEFLNVSDFLYLRIESATA